MPARYAEDAFLAFARRSRNLVPSAQTVATRSQVFAMPGRAANRAAVTAAVAPNPVVSVNHLAQPEEEDVFTGHSSVVQKAVVAVFRVIRGVAARLRLPNPLEKLAPLLSAPKPPALLTLGLDVGRSEFEGMTVWTLKSPGSTSAEKIVELHGGAYVLEMNAIEWISASTMARRTGATVIVPIYPLAPGATASTVVPSIARLLAQQVNEYGSDNVSVLGGSAGGGMALAAAQHIAAHPEEFTSSGGSLLQPSRMVLVSPWLDVSMSDPDSHKINDPISTFDYLQNAGLLWAGDLSASDPLASPLFGSFENLPQISVYSGSLDLLSPDSVRLMKRAQAEGIPMYFDLLDGGIHGWAGFFFLPESKAVTPQMYEQLLGTRSPN